MTEIKDEGVTELPEEEATKQMDIDNIFEKIGQFGLLQTLYVFLLCLFQVQKSNQTLIMTFVGNSPDWKCVSNNTECNMTKICFWYIPKMFDPYDIFVYQLMEKY